MVKFGTNASGAIWWTTLWLMRVWPTLQLAKNGMKNSYFSALYLVGKFATNAIGVIWNQFQTILVERFTQVMNSCPGSVVPLAMFHPVFGELQSWPHPVFGTSIVASLALVAKLATRLSHFHCHIVLECPIGIISWHFVCILISQSHISWVSKTLVSEWQPDP